MHMQLICTSYEYVKMFDLEHFHILLRGSFAVGCRSVWRDYTAEKLDSTTCSNGANTYKTAVCNIANEINRRQHVNAIHHKNGRRFNNKKNGSQINSQKHRDTRHFLWKWGSELYSNIKKGCWIHAVQLNFIRPAQYGIISHTFCKHIYSLNGSAV